MLTLPAPFLTDFEAGTSRPSYVYEITLNDGTTTLYFGSQRIDWGGNTYTAAVLSSSDLAEYSDGRKVSSIDVTFSNVTFPLRPYFRPVNQLTGGKLLVRLLMRDATGAWRTESMVRWKGIIQPPRDINETEFVIQATGIEAIKQPIPARSFAVRCQALFKDIAGDPALGVPANPDGDCGYAGALVTCNRIFDHPDGCQGRGRQHEFLAFKVVEIATEIPSFLSPDEQGPIQNPYFDIVPKDVPKPTTPIPLLYGRKRVRGVFLSGNLFRYPESRDLGWFRREVYVISEGEIDEIFNWYDGDEPTANKYMADPNEPGVNRLVMGMWYRKGVIGGAAYSANEGEEGGAVNRPQWQDRTDVLNELGGFPSVYSKLCYVTFVYGPFEVNTDPFAGDERIPRFEGEVPNVTFDAGGLLIQRYLSTGAADGAKVNSRNPVWQIIDLLLHKRYGIGRFVDASDIDFAAAKATADYADTLVIGTEPVTQVSREDLTADTSYRVKSTAGFYPGMAVTYNGAPDTCFALSGSFDMYLGVARQQFVGDVIQGSGPRFTSDYYITSRTTARNIIRNILAGCRGYLRYAGGKLQVEIDRPQTQTGIHLNEPGGAMGYQMLRGSALDNVDHQRNWNRVRVNFRNNDRTDELVETAWERWWHDEERVLSVSAPAVNSRDVATRVGAYWLKRSELGPTGRATYGPAASQLQIGDRCLATVVEFNWIAADVIVRGKREIGLGQNEEFFVELDLEPYSDNTYPDQGYIAGQDLPDPVFTVLLTLQGASLDAVTLHWSSPEITPAFVKEWHIFKRPDPWEGATPPADRPHAHERIAIVPGWQFTFDYVPTAFDLGQTRYFSVAAVGFDGSRTFSNDLRVEMPGSEQVGDNMVFDGDYRDPRRWFGVEPTIVFHAPTLNAANTPEDTVGLTNPNLAADSNTGDWAEGPYNTAGMSSAGQQYYFAGASWSNPGVIRFHAALQLNDDPPIYNGRYVLAYRKSTSDPWVLVLSGRNINFDDFWTSLLELVPADVQVKVRAIPETTEFSDPAQGQGNFAIVGFEEYTGSYAKVVGDTAVFKAPDTSTWVELRGLFPGEHPPNDTRVMIAGERYIVRQAFKKVGSGTVNGEIEIGLVNTVTGTRTVLFQINGTDNDYADVLTTFRHFAVVFKPDSDIEGPVDVYTRMKSTVPVVADKFMIYPGVTLGDDFAANAGEQSGGFRVSKSGARQRVFGRQSPPVGPTTYIFVETDGDA